MASPIPPGRSTPMPAGDGSFYLYLDGVVRAASGTGTGDTVEVSVAFDREYRSGPQHDMLPAFVRAPRGRPFAPGPGGTAFAPSLRKEVLRYLANLEIGRGTATERRARHSCSGRCQGKILAREWNWSARRAGRHICNL